jgi:hypothetical protein
MISSMGMLSEDMDMKHGDTALTCKMDMLNENA